MHPTTRGVVGIPKLGCGRPIMPAPPGVDMTDPPVGRVALPIPAEHRLPGLEGSSVAPAAFGPDAVDHAQSEPNVMPHGPQVQHAAVR